MIAFVVLVIFAVVAAVNLAMALNRRAEWERFGRAAGMRVRGGIFRRLVLEGMVDGVDVTCEVVKRGRLSKNVQLWTRAAARAPGLAEHLVLQSRARDTVFGRVFAEREAATGDATFDREVVVRGPAPAALALLDGPTRAMIATLAERNGSVLHGAVTREVRGALQSSELQTLIDDVTGIARLLAKAKDEAARLVENARSDPNADVRLANLRSVLEHHPAAAQEALQHALLDRDPRLRFEAARRQRTPESAAALVKLVVERAPNRAEAMEALMAFSHVEAAPAIASALGRFDPPLQVAATRAAVAFHDASLCERIAALPAGTSVELAVAIASALQALGDARFEPRLLALLQHDDKRVRLAAADALGAVGTAAAVERLLRATEGVLLDGALKDASRAAIRRIQERLGDADAGRMSLADAQGGEVSLSAPAGAVSKVRG